MEALKQAKEAAEQLLEITKALVLTGVKDSEEADVEAYHAMLEEREPLVDELTDLRDQMDDDVLSSPEFAEIKQIISEIAKENERHNNIIKLMQKNAQASYKEIKQGQRIHAGYNPLPGDEVSSKLDIKH